MIVVLDANFLAILLSNTARVPLDPITGRPYERAGERIENLIQTLQDEGAKIIVPTPALGEFLILAHPFWGKYISELRGNYRFEVADFDEMAAIELAELSTKISKPAKLKRGEQTWAKLKFDRQIVAIAIARGADSIYSTDEALRKLAEQWSIKAYDLCHTPLPPATQLLLTENGNTLDDRETSVIKKEASFEAGK